VFGPVEGFMPTGTQRGGAGVPAPGWEGVGTEGPLAPTSQPTATTQPTGGNTYITNQYNRTNSDLVNNTMTRGQ